MRRLEGGGGLGATREALSGGGRAGAGAASPGGGRNRRGGGGEESSLGFGGDWCAKFIKALKWRWERRGWDERRLLARAGRATGDVVWP